MARPTNQAEDVIAALEEVPVSPRNNRVEVTKARRVKAISLALAGLSYAQIGEQLEISETGARNLVMRTLTQAENQAVDERRAVENTRLDRAQAAIWSQVLEGDHKAISSFLRISDQRAKINGLYAPTNVNLNVSVKNEMETALEELEALVLDNFPEIEGTEDAEIVRDDDPEGDSDADAE